MTSGPWGTPTNPYAPSTTYARSTPYAQPNPYAAPAPYPSYSSPSPYGYASVVVPRKKRSRVPLIIGIIVALIIIGPLLVSVLNAIVGASGVFDTQPSPSSNRTGLGSAMQSPTTRNTPGPATTTQRGDTPLATTLPQIAANPPITYVPGKPDLHPPDPPLPKTYGDLTWALENNPLYDQTLSSGTPCSVTEIDLTTASPRQIQTYMNGFVDCLMAAWYPPVVYAGFHLPHPSVTVYTSPVTTPCGDMEMYNAAYCSGDQQIYYAQNMADIVPPRMQGSRFIAESIIAHEFGHAVQYRTEILFSESYLEQEAKTQGEADQYSRRLELQADCFAGLFLRSVAASAGFDATDESNVVALFTSFGDEEANGTHGQGPSRAYWSQQGLGSSTPGVCRTFIAPDSRVK